MNICIIGCGSIGSVLTRAVSRFPEINTIYLFDRSEKNSVNLAKEIPKASSIKELNEIKENCDLAIEAASQPAVKDYGMVILDMGMDLMVMSVGALMNDRLYSSLKQKAAEKNRKIYIPSGAIGGLDVLNSAAIENIYGVSLKTSKPPEGLTGIEFITKAGIDVEKIERPTVVFDGDSREATEKFPLNINVASILALAGGGKKKTRVRIIVDPDIERNVHEISMHGDFGEMKCTVQNTPHPKNPKTSYLAALSAIAMIKKIVGVVHIGS